MKSLTFNGNGYEYFKIWIVNILLTIITLGLFYPWAKVRTKRYFYGNTTLEGRNFEYHATGKQLLVGFLIAVMFLIAYSFISGLSLLINISFFILLSFFIPWVIWRSLKFNARMTSFGNVYFNFSGSLIKSYFCYFLIPCVMFLCSYVSLVMIAVMIWLGTLPLLVLFILFLMAVVFTLAAFAWFKASSLNYLMNGYGYGQGVFESDIETSPIAKFLVKSGVLVVVFLVIFFFLGFLFLSFLFKSGIDLKLAFLAVYTQSSTINVMTFFYIIAMYILIIVFSKCVIGYFSASVRAYALGNLLFDDKVTFRSSLTALNYSWLLLTNFFIVIFTCGLGTPWAKVRKTKMLVENTYISDDIDLNSYVTEQEEEQSALADQLGDAFDVGIDVAI